MNTYWGLLRRLSSFRNYRFGAGIPASFRVLEYHKSERTRMMLKSDDVLNFLRQHKQYLETRYSVKRIGVFGSIFRGNASDKSDVDILVELSAPTFDHYMDLKFFLEDHLGRPVDLVLADSLKPRVKTIITREVAYA